LAEVGRHPEVIAAALKAANDDKAKSLRPLRSKMAEVDKRIRVLSSEVQNCVEAAKRKGAQHIGEDFLAEPSEMPGSPLPDPDKSSN
jgi:hypothetical protein